MAVILHHDDLAQHHRGLGHQLRKFWMDHRFCDVILKSRDGTQHVAHKAVLAAASRFFENLLGGPFLEADRVVRGQPIDIVASGAAVRALLDYIYGGQPAVEVDISLELVRLSEAYDLPKLTDAIVAGFLVSLDGNMALKVLQEAQGLHKLKNACEEKVAQDFEECSQHPDFGKLTVTQLARLLKRDDLEVSREEIVLGGILKWLRLCQDRQVFLGTLLQHVDFRAISFRNLTRLRTFASSIGAGADDLQREVDEAIQHKQPKRALEPPDSTTSHFRPKRRRLQHWSPDLGAYDKGGVREVFPVPCNCLSWHDGALYCVDYQGKIWKWNEEESQSVVISNVPLSGSDEELRFCDLFHSPSGEMFLSDYDNDQLVCIQDGRRSLLPGSTGLQPLYGALCSPNGVLYVVNQDGKAVHKLMDSQVETVMVSDKLPEDLQFTADAIAVTKEEVIYLMDEGGRILRINPGDARPSVVVEFADQEVFSDQEVQLSDLFVTDSGTIYVGEEKQRKIWAFHPGNATCTEVLECFENWIPVALLVRDDRLYVSMASVASDEEDFNTGRVYQYMLDPELHLESLQ